MRRYRVLAMLIVSVLFLFINQLHSQPLKNVTPNNKLTTDPEATETLTYSQKRFCQEYVANKGNGTKAALIAYNATTDGSAASTASVLLKSPKIQAEIARIGNETTSASITPELITAEIAKIAINEKNTAGTRLKGLELLGRIRAMFIDRIEQRQVIVDKSIDLSGLSTPQLLAALQARLRLSASGIRETQKPAELDAAPVLDAPNDAVALGTVDEAHFTDLALEPVLADHQQASQYTSAQCDAPIAIITPLDNLSAMQGQGTHTEQSNDVPGGGGMPLPGPVGE